MTYQWSGDSAGVITGEAVAVDLRPARAGSRTIAYALDLIVQVVALLLVGWVWGATGTMDSASSSAIGIVLILAVMLGYPVVLPALWQGRTLGKAALGLRIVRDDGGPAPVRSLLLRELVGLFVERPGPTFGGIAIIASMTSARGQRLGDRWAGTLVVQNRTPGMAAPPPEMPPQLAAWAATLDLSRLPDGLALAARQFLARSPSLLPAAREQVGAQLTTAVAQYVGPPPAGYHGWMFLAAVTAERRRREMARAWQAQPSPATSWSAPGGTAPLPPVAALPPPAMPAPSPYGGPLPTPPAPPTPPGGFVAPN